MKKTKQGITCGPHNQISAIKCFGSLVEKTVWYFTTFFFLNICTFSHVQNVKIISRISILEAKVNHFQRIIYEENIWGLAFPCYFT